jgi:hypothetical protein
MRPGVEEDKKIYFADFNVHPVDSKWVAAIREDHHPPKIEDIENTLVVINSHDNGWIDYCQRSGYLCIPPFQFKWQVDLLDTVESPKYALETIRSCGWETGRTAKSPTKRVIAGREAKASVTQPQWSPDESLFFADDRTGHWQLYHPD